MKFNALVFIFFNIICLFLAVKVFAQHGEVIFKVNDRWSNSPLPFAIIQLKSEDGTIEKAIANKAGVVSFGKLKRDKYDVIGSYVGYQTKDTLITIHADSDKIFLISLTPDIKNLNEVEVKSKKPYLMMSKGKLILNLQDSPLAKTGNLWNTLKYAPTVETSVTGKLTIKNQSVAVYLDGRRIYLTGVELMNYLKSIDAGNTEQIEIISHPGAAYPSDIQTVINIISAKLKQDGMRNVISGTGAIGKFARYSLSDNLIVNKGPYNFQVNYNFSDSKLEDKKFYNTLNMNIYPWETTQLTQTQQTQHRVSANLNVNTGKNTILTFYTEIQPNHLSVTSNSNNGEPTPARVNTKDSIFLSSSKIKNQTFSAFFQTSLETKWDSTRKSFRVQLEYFNNPRKYTNDYNTSNFLNGGFLRVKNLMDSLPQDVKTFVASSEYRSILFKGEMTAGLRFSTTDLTNFNQTISLTDHDVIAVSSLKYLENNYAGFVNWAKEFDQFYISAGARFEELTVHINNQDGSLPDRYKLFSYLPSFLMQWKLNKIHVLELSYKKNIVKPDYFQLNSFKRYSGNSIADFQGNENIKPQTNHTLDLTWTRANALSVSGGIVFMKNFISTLFLKDSANNLYEQYTNFSKTKLYYLNVAYVTNIVSFWQIRLNANSFLIDAKFNGIQSENATPSVNLTYTNSFSLPKNWVIETAAFVNNTFKDGFFEHQKYGNAQLAIQKNLPASNLTFTVSGNLRLGADQSNKSLYNHINYADRGYSDTNIASLNISWNFGKTTVKSVDKQKSESDEVKQRIKDRN